LPEVTVAVLSIGDKRLGAVLLERGYVSDDALQHAIGRHAEVGGRLADVLVQIGVISEQRIARAVEESIGIPLVMLPRVDVMPEALAKVPANTAFEVGALPFAVDGHRLRVAFEDPLDALALEEIEDVSGCVVEPYQGLQSEIKWALATYYPELGLTPPVDVQVDTSLRLGALAVAKGLLTRRSCRTHRGAAAHRRSTRPHPDQARPPRRGRSSRSSSPSSTNSRSSPRSTGCRSTNILASQLLRLDAVQFGAVPLRHEDEGWSWRWPIRAASRRRGDRPGAGALRREPGRPGPEADRAMYAHDKGRLGETLLIGKKLKREQLRKALEEQAKLGKVKPLGEVLVDLGYVTQLDVDEALNKQRSGGGRLEDTLVQSGKISPEMLAKSLAMQLGYEYIDDGNAKVDPLVVTWCPSRPCGATRRCRSASRPTRPRRGDEGPAPRLRARRHPPDHGQGDPAGGGDRGAADADDQPLLPRRRRHGRARAGHARGGPRRPAPGRGGHQRDRRQRAGQGRQQHHPRGHPQRHLRHPHRAAPRPTVIVRVRKDGSLREYMTMPKATSGALAARIKIMGGLNIAERRLPQDGRIRYKDRSTEVDLRLSTLPTVYGEKIVMRLLKKATSIPEIEQLGFAAHNFQRFTDVIKKPYGMFLITGPTGSGKSFTTFSILKRIATPDVNVTTVEDPVEYEVPGINQTQVNVKAGLDFARALRSFLRQDPDIIMVGEIRDHETAKIAMEAALTGHLLIATLHTNDSAGRRGAPHRDGDRALQRLGLAHRRARPAPRAPRLPRLPGRVHARARRAAAPRHAAEEIRGKKLFRGVGCEKCGGSGYNGRYAIHELLVVDDALSTAIVKEASALEIKEIAMRRGMRTLREDGVLKAFEGITTLEEVLARTAE
jgi:type IV pilus assembly protein PilB